MKIAILGAGFAGLSAAYYLVEAYPGINITLFDPSPLGENASGVSLGLMHAYLGLKPRKSWQAEEGRKETLKLLDLVEEELQETISQRQGIFRPLSFAWQKEVFQKLAEKHEDVFFWDKEQVQACFSPYLPKTCCGIYISSGIAVDTQSYVKGLVRLLQKKGIQWEKKEISSLSECSSFDQILICTGEKTLFFFPEKSLYLERIKGQVLSCHWPFKKALYCPIVANALLTCWKKEKVCYLGSTYERNFSSLQPDAFAEQDILTRASSFFPAVFALPILHRQTAVRLSNRKGYLPCLERVDEKVSLFTALGSRGLLYHALFAKRLAKTFFSSNKQSHSLVASHLS